jgi:4-aminobutyrate aminotransferase-like enzyme
MDTVAWANPPAADLPVIVQRPPGPASVEWHERMVRHAGGALTAMVQLFPVAYERGHGVTLTDVDGNTYIDFSSGIVITNLGHAHPLIAEAIGRAATELDNVHDFATPHKVKALEALESVTPPGMSLFTFFSAGTEAVEGAMRVARAATGRNGFVSFHRDFHGRTGGAASITAFRSSNGPRDPMSMLVPNGHCYRCSFHLEPTTCGLRCAGFVGESIEQNMPGQVAGVVAEVITNANGATVYQPGYLTALQKEAHLSGALLVVDEVATGFGRTGAWFAVDHEGVVPDIMAMGKGMGNGFPVTAIAVKADLADAFTASYPSTSYGGNPMACAAVSAVVDVMQRERIVDHARQLGEFALARMDELAGRHPIVGEVRGKGALLAIELVKDRRTKEPFDEAGNFVYRHAFANGVAWATAGNILRITPPIVMSNEVFAKGLDIVEEAIGAAEKEFGYG